MAEVNIVKEFLRIIDIRGHGIGRAIQDPARAAHWWKTFRGLLEAVHGGNTSATARQTDEDRGTTEWEREAREVSPGTNKHTEHIYCFEGIK